MSNNNETPVRKKYNEEWRSLLRTAEEMPVFSDVEPQHFATNTPDGLTQLEYELAQAKSLQLLNFLRRLLRDIKPDNPYILIKILTTAIVPMFGLIHEELPVGHQKVQASTFLGELVGLFQMQFRQELERKQKEDLR